LAGARSRPTPGIQTHLARVRRLSTPTGAPTRAHQHIDVAPHRRDRKEHPMTDETPGTAGITETDFAYLERLAAAAADSGLYGSGAKVKAQLLMKLIYGRDL
jgi:hypothetical protein